MALAQTKMQGSDSRRSQNLPSAIRSSDSQAIESSPLELGGSLVQPIRDNIAKRSPKAIITLIGRLVLVIGLGLIGGWILLSYVLGWELPWNTREVPYTPMSPVAEQYWRNLDVAQVQRDMPGWKPEDLAKLFVTIQSQAFDPETRTHLSDLGKTLRLPGFVPSSALLTTLLRQPGFLIGIMLTIAIWGAAAFIGLAPLVRRSARANPLEDLRLQDLSTDQVNLGDLVPDLSLETSAPGSENKAEEKKDGQAETPTAQSEEETSSGLGDLSSLFEEEETSITALEAFCKNLAEIGIDNLNTKIKEVSRDLRNFIAQKPSGKSA